MPISQPEAERQIDAAGRALEARAGLVPPRPPAAPAPPGDLAAQVQQLPAPVFAQFTEALLRELTPPPTLGRVLRAVGEAEPTTRGPSAWAALVAGARGVQQAFGGALAAVGERLRWRRLIQLGEWLEDVAPAPLSTDPGLDQDFLDTFAEAIDHPERLAQPWWWERVLAKTKVAAASGAGSQLAFFAPAAAAAALTGGGGVLPLLAGAVVEAIAEGGGAYLEAKAQGADEDEAFRRAALVAGANVPLITGTAVLGYLPRGASRSLARQVVDAVRAGVVEPVQEVAQQAIQNLVNEQPVTAGWVESAIGGVVGGPVTSAVLETGTLAHRWLRVNDRVAGDRRWRDALAASATAPDPGGPIRAYAARAGLTPEETENAVRLVQDALRAGAAAADAVVAKGGVRDHALLAAVETVHRLLPTAGRRARDLAMRAAAPWVVLPDDLLEGAERLAQLVTDPARQAPEAAPAAAAALGRWAMDPARVQEAIQAILAAPDPAQAEAHAEHAWALVSPDLFGLTAEDTRRVWESLRARAARPAAAAAEGPDTAQGAPPEGAPQVAITSDEGASADVADSAVRETPATEPTGAAIGERVDRARAALEGAAPAGGPPDLGAREGGDRGADREPPEPAREPPVGGGVGVAARGVVGLPAAPGAGGSGAGSPAAAAPDTLTLRMAAAPAPEPVPPELAPAAAPPIPWAGPAPHSPEADALLAHAQEPARARAQAGGPRGDAVAEQARQLQLARQALTPEVPIEARWAAWEALRQRLGLPPSDARGRLVAAARRLLTEQGLAPDRAEQHAESMADALLAAPTSWDQYAFGPQIAQLAQPARVQEARLSARQRLATEARRLTGQAPDPEVLARLDALDTPEAVAAYTEDAVRALALAHARADARRRLAAAAQEGRPVDPALAQAIETLDDPDAIARTVERALAPPEPSTEEPEDSWGWLIHVPAEVSRTARDDPAAGVAHLAADVPSSVWRSPAFQRALRDPAAAQAWIAASPLGARPGGQPLEDQPSPSLGEPGTGTFWYRPRRLWTVTATGRALRETAALVAQLEREGRPPTRDEAERLAAYPGVGVRAVADTLVDDQALAALLAPEAIARLVEVNPTSYYTGYEGGRLLWVVLRTLGVPTDRALRVLEPTAGAGHLLATMPPELARIARVTAADLDPIAVRVLRWLYEPATVLEGAIEEIPLPHGQDVVVANVPFSGTRRPSRLAPEVADSLHDLTLWRIVDSLRPGGLAAVITSRFTLDRRDPAFRRALVARAELVAGWRLPAGALPHTRVVADLLIFRRRQPGERPRADERPWIEARPAPDWLVDRVGADWTALYGGRGPRPGRGRGRGRRRAAPAVPIAVNEFYAADRPERSPIIRLLWEADPARAILADARALGDRWEEPVAAPEAPDPLPPAPAAPAAPGAAGAVEIGATYRLDEQTGQLFVRDPETGAWTPVEECE